MIMPSKKISIDLEIFPMKEIKSISIIWRKPPETVTPLT